MKTYTMKVLCKGGVEFRTHSITEDERLDLLNIDFTKGLVFSEDSNGTTVCINLNHALSVSYYLEGDKE